MAADYRDFGVGVATLRGVPLYVFLFACRSATFSPAQIAGLADLPAVRSEMLARVNAARRAAPPGSSLRDPHLDAAAQEHAQDMLARTYYDHNTPEGRTPASGWRRPAIWRTRWARTSPRGSLGRGVR